MVKYNNKTKEIALNIYKHHKSSRTASTFCNISKSTIINWKNTPPNELYTKKNRSGKFTPNIKCYIRNYVLAKITFDVKKLIRNIRRIYKIKISKSSIYNILHKMKISHKKIRNLQINKNKRIFRRKITEFKNKMKKINIGNIISLDETSVDTFISPLRGWSEAGTRIERKFSFQRKRITLISSITNKYIMNNKMIEGTANAKIFKEFLEELIIKIKEKYGENEKVYLLLDNARIHHAKIIKEFIINYNNIELLFNPPYCPQYNPIERLFSKLKNELRKKYNVSLKLIKENIIKICGNINSRELNNYFNNSLVNELFENKILRKIIYV